MKTYPAYPETKSEIDPQVLDGVHRGIRKLDHYGSHLAGYWCCELFDVDGSPIPHRLTSHVLFLIEKDIMQCVNELGDS